MLKWADETRRKLNSTDSESSNADSDVIKTITACQQEKPADLGSVLVITTNQSTKAVSPVQKRRQRKLQALQERRRHSSCGQLYASPDQIVLAWNNSKQAPTSSLPNTPSHTSNEELSLTGNNNLTQSKPTNRNSSPPMLTKPELLQIADKQGDKNRNSFWKNLMGKKSWPSRTYKSPPMRKSHSVVETYRKIEESYYTDSHPCGEIKHNCEQDTSDYGLSDLVISCDAPVNRSKSKDLDGSMRSHHSLKTIRRQSDSRRPKLFVRRSSGQRSKSPDSGFSDIRLSMSMTDDLDTERDSGVPRSPTLSSSSSSSDDSACYRKS